MTRTVQQHGLVLLSARRWASRLAGSAGSGGRKDSGVLDRRYQLMKDMMYAKVTPSASSGARRPPPAKLEEEVVERTWALVKEREAQAVRDDLRSKYRCMRAAMEELERTDKRLFVGTGAFAKKARTEELVLFPRTLRVPTETPPKDGWK
ncbi:hypothetical protein HK405_004266 [Cladochytrium tenue]|nr:hypothetical protein HK405_004266 [Cladochytrium tenue]